MDFQFWIWLIVIVITLIARANKKKAGAAPPPENLPDSSPSQQPKAVTFEDLLREIQGEKAMSQQPKPKPVAQAKPKEYDFIDYDDDIPDEIQDLTDADYMAERDREVKEKYEAAQKEAKYEPISKKKEEVGRIVRSEHFKEYDLKVKKSSFNFLGELKDPKGFRKAFIMSEILNKKY